ncbi:lipopolysaccharide biosynthesis protein [Sphingorhabdus sp.]|uniref:lipopolysaccharide biosynthesis protein n=1 Tax=Sphingorhabdus sp. TaxID=1902408 RepID=UPI003918C68A
MKFPPLSTDREPQEFRDQVKSAVFWRSGTQILAQLISWGTTIAVIRILEPSDYGIFAMTSVVLVFLNFLNGYGFVSALIQSETVEPIRIRQAFGMLILLNAALAALQFLVVAPLAAVYFDEPVVADMLRWQSLIYLSTPFLILPDTMLARNLDFKKPAIVNLASAIIGAAVALAMAVNGQGVWTLVFAPIAIFWTRAIALMLATRFWVRPSFNFSGARGIFTFGTAMLIAHGFWIIQSQSDIFIAGRAFDNHDLGLYAEALFLTQIFAAKFVPPLNEVAFPAYARLQNDMAALAAGFLKAVRLIMLISCPLYFGMAVTAQPLVEAVMGPKWSDAAPLVAILALAMPVMTLHILFAPALNALGLPHLVMRNAMFGAVLMPSVYLNAVQYGAHGLAWGWLITFPILLAFTIHQARPHIGYTLNALAASVLPGLTAAAIMAALVWTLDHGLLAKLWPDVPAILQLAILTAAGAATYFGILWVGARETIWEVKNLVMRRKPPTAEPVVTP